MEGRFLMKFSSFSDDIALLIWGAFRHPEESVRASLREDHDNWIESCSPVHSRDQIREALLQAQGSFLEPYSFPAEILEESISVVQVAFSRASQSFRVYVSTADPELPCSGMILTNNLRHACLERYALGSFRKPSRQAWAIFPMDFPDSSFSHPLIEGSAILVCDDEGFDIRVCWPGKFNEDDIEESLETHSRFSGRDRLLSDYGISVRRCDEQGEFSLRTGSPESMIKLLTVLEKGGELLLDAGENSRNLMRISLLPASDEDETPLPVKVCTKGRGLPWIEAMQPRTMGRDRTRPDIRTTGKAALARKFPYPLEWREAVDPILNES
jgi:hypothetical protein